MKMPPENIAIFNHNATVAPSAEPPRIPSDTPAALNDTVKYEDPWEVALVPAEATKFNMLSISRHHQPGHWMAPLLHQRRSRSGGHQLPLLPKTWSSITLDVLLAEAELLMMTWLL